MNIQSINELTLFPIQNTDIRSLSADTITSFIEMSYPEGDNHISYKLQFNTFLKSVCRELENISALLKQLSNVTDDIKDTYVKLSGDTMTGPLIITDGTESIVNTTLLSVNGKTQLNNDILVYGGNVGTSLPHIETVNGQLYCNRADIVGCAISAKWC